MKIALIITLSLVFSIGIGILLLIRSWTQTPHGTLTTPAAIISRIATWQEAGLARMDAASQRESRRKSMPLVTTAGPDLAEVTDRSIGGPLGPIPVRIYRALSGTTPVPAIIYYHGGGWVFGDLDSHDNVCRQLAFKTGAQVIAVDYRLGPEHRYPAAVDDAYAAVRWATSDAKALGIDPTRIALAGDSAGANLAAAVTLKARDQGGPALAAQVLIYPAVDLSNLNRKSMLDFAHGYFLTRARMDWFFDQYIPVIADRRQSYASPLLAGDHTRLPPAIIVTAQFDPLRDEGREYAQALSRAGVSVQSVEIPGVIHGFSSMDRWFPEANQTTDLIAQFLHDRLETR